MPPIATPTFASPQEQEYLRMLRGEKRRARDVDMGAGQGPDEQVPLEAGEYEKDVARRKQETPAQKKKTEGIGKAKELMQKLGGGGGGMGLNLGRNLARRLMGGKGEEEGGGGPEELAKQAAMMAARQAIMGVMRTVLWALIPVLIFLLKIVLIVGLVILFIYFVQQVFLSEVPPPGGFKERPGVRY